MSDEATIVTDSQAVNEKPVAEVERVSFLRRMWRRFKRFIRRNSVSFYAFALATIVLLMLVSTRTFITIPAGHVGVLWLRFFGGTAIDTYYSEGIHVIFPWDELIIYDARLQNSARLYDTISSNGLGMQVEIATRYRINREAVGLLHKLVGPKFDEILVFPEIGSHARELISRYTPEQLYSETRGFIQAQILERMVTQLGSSLINQSVRGKLVDVEDVLIRSVTLPPKIQEAIQRKAEQYQAMLEYDFRIARERKERDRKRIEAEGVRDFQAIVAKTITGEYLRLRGIEATMALSNSRNSKIIIIGGKDGLPVILNTADAMQTSPDTDDQTQTTDVHAQPSNARASEVTPPNASTTPSEPGGALTPSPALPGAAPSAPLGKQAEIPAARSPSVWDTSASLDASGASPPTPVVKPVREPVQKEGGNAPVEKEGGSTVSTFMNMLKP